MNLRELIGQVEMLKGIRNATLSDVTTHSSTRLIGIKQAVEAIDKSRIVYCEKGDWGNNSEDFDDWKELKELLGLNIPLNSVNSEGVRCE